MVWWTLLSCCVFALYYPLFSAWIVTRSVPATFAAWGSLSLVSILPQLSYNIPSV